MFLRSQHEVQILSIAAAEHVRLCCARTCHSELLSTSLLSSGSGAFSAGCLGSRFFYLQVRKAPRTSDATTLLYVGWHGVCCPVATLPPPRRGRHG